MTTRAASRLGVALAALAAIVLGGCASTGATRPAALPGQSVPLPSDPLALLDIAQREFRATGPIVNVETSFAAADKALVVAPKSDLARYFVARSAKWLLEFGKNLATDRARELAAKGLDAATALLARDPDNAEYVFLDGALQGYKMQHATIPNPLGQKKILERFRKAAKTDPWIDQGGPLRAVGAILIKSPPWPAGVGDTDEGLDHLRQAVLLFPVHPANRYYLGLALVADRQKDAAKKEFEEARRLCQDARWGAVCETYLPKAEAELTALSGTPANH